MAAKIQYRGHCPCCGNQQAVIQKSGLMSKHGYKVEHGWFNGICSGQGHKPMEVERKTAEAIILQVRKEVEQLREKEADLKSGAFVPETCPEMPYRYKAKRIPWAEASEYAQEGEKETLSNQLHSRARTGEQFANQLEELLNKVHGQPLIEVVKEK